jgi:hypothetical protein
MLASRTDQFSVSVQLHGAGGIVDRAWWLTVVYGPTAEDQKVAYLDELRAMRAAASGPWAVAGDFNLIVDARDKSNARLNRRWMGMF